MLMAKFICNNSSCGQEFTSKHSTAKYCSRKCSGKVNQRAALIEQKYSDEELLQFLIDKAKELGRTPGKRELTNPVGTTYQRRFGSYTNAVIAAGLEPNRQLPERVFSTPEQLVSLKLRFKILQRDKFTCQYCGGTPELGYTLHVDHILPKSKGGKAEESNLITACWLCNTGKSDGALV